MVDVIYAGCCLCGMSLMVGAFFVLLNVVITIVKAPGKDPYLKNLFVI